MPTPKKVVKKPAAKKADNKISKAAKAPKAPVTEAAAAPTPSKASIGRHPGHL